MRPAPRPTNFDAMSDAWNHPDAFAVELARYYAQLRAEGILDAPVDRTEPRHARG